MNNIEDLDYLYPTARTRAMEKNLLSRDRLVRMCEARSTEDVVKVLEECGWTDVNFNTLADVEKSLAAQRSEAFRTALSIAPDKSLVEIFIIKYDYHNIKTILKGEATGEPYDHLLIDSGTIPAKTLISILHEGNYSSLSPAMRRGVEEARDILNRTGDPQYSDIALDRACFSEMSKLAKASQSNFMIGYVALLIDSVNLRSAVRIKRMGRSYDYLKQSFIEGGTVGIGRLLADLTPDLLESVYASTPLREAAVAGGAALRGEAGLTQLDLLCDDALTHYLQAAKYVGLGEQPLLGYVAAKEAELTAIRTVMSGRLAGLTTEMIMERLRDSYV